MSSVSDEVTEPLVDADDECPSDDDPYLQRVPTKLQSFELESAADTQHVARAVASSRLWRCVAISLGVLTILLLAFAGRTVYREHTEIVPESRVSVAAAAIVTNMGNYSSRCTEPWDYACGRYASKSLAAVSAFDDAQATADAKLVAVLLKKPPTFAPRQFYEACTATDESITLERPDPYWWWDRGLVFKGLAFGRARSNTSRYRNLAVQISESAGGAPDDDCAFAPKTACDGRLWAAIVRVSGEASFDEQLCVLGGSAELACNVFNDAVSNSSNKTGDNQLVFTGSPTFCVRETKRLWPSATSEVWEAAYSTDEADATVLHIFEDARSAIANKLRQQHQNALSEAVSKVRLFQRYVGPPEVYHAARNKFEDVALWWEELLVEKEEFDRARLFFSEQDWDMAAHTINAYYWPYANSVFVTQAIADWMLYGAGEAERIGRLGFLLGHELGHAIHSNIDVLDDPTVKAAYRAGEMCLTEEYGGKNAVTTHEDMADRVGYGVVGALMVGAATHWSRYCARDGCILVGEKHSAFLAAAQPFCATASLADTKFQYDTHSANKVRVRHSLQGTAAAAAAWDCKVPAQVSLCPVVGAPTLY